MKKIVLAFLVFSLFGCENKKPFETYNKLTFIETSLAGSDTLVVDSATIRLTGDAFYLNNYLLKAKGLTYKNNEVFNKELNLSLNKLIQKIPEGDYRNYEIEDGLEVFIEIETKNKVYRYLFHETEFDELTALRETLRKAIPHRYFQH